MAIILENQYTNAIAATAAYPYGSVKNATAPGLLDGTPLDRVWKDDHLGFLYAMLGAAGITPTEVIDTALLSQYFQALKYVAGRNIYDPLINYGVGGIAVGSDDNWYIVLVANGPATSVVNPVGDLTGTWGFFTGGNLIPLSGGGTVLKGYRYYELTDSLTYDLPLANTVQPGGWIWVELPDLHQLEEPTVQATGADTITDIDGVDPDGEVLFNSETSVRIRFISDGVSDWRI